jgi:choline-sulfatase
MASSCASGLAAGLLLAALQACSSTARGPGDRPPPTGGSAPLPQGSVALAPTGVPSSATSSGAAATAAGAAGGAGPSASPSASPVGPTAAPVKLNVLLVTVDAMRADMPWAGYPRAIAPNLTAWEARSVSYTRAYSVSSYTAMSVGGFLAGRYPSEMARSGSFFSAYPESETLFPELLQAAGVRTVAAHAHFYFDTKAGFRQGFDVYRMVEGLTTDNKTDRNVTSPQHLKLALELLSDPANTSRQFFAWFHFMDPHDLYMTHEGVPDFGKKARDRYDGEIYFTDQHVGQLLDFVSRQPWGERTAIIINSDHGEAFGEHGRTRHGFELWEPLVHVPLFIHLPGATPHRIETPRSMIDLAPTIVELLGLPPQPAFQGKSLLPELRGQASPEERPVIVDLPRTGDNDRRRAMVLGRYKLISFGDDFRFELYDLQDDPGEDHDLRKTKPEIYRMMRQRYDERVKGIHDICPQHRDKLKNKSADRPC